MQDLLNFHILSNYTILQYYMYVINFKTQHKSFIINNIIYLYLTYNNIFFIRTYQNNPRQYKHKHILTGTLH